MQVKSSVKLNMTRINELTQAAVTALEKTGEALHTEVVQAQVMPFDTGHLQEDATFVDYSESSQGKVSLVISPEAVLPSGIQLSDRRKPVCWWRMV